MKSKFKTVFNNFLVEMSLPRGFSSFDVMSVEDFLDLLNEVGIPAVDYPPEDLDDEVEIFSK